MNKSFLTQNIALGFPLPYNDLSSLFDSQAYPCTRLVYTYAANLKAPNSKSLYLIYLLTD